MQSSILYLTGLLLAGNLVAAGTPIASDDFLSRPVTSDIQRSDETSQESGGLGRLALGLSAGPEAMRALRGSKSENDHNKDRLEPPQLQAALPSHGAEAISTRIKALTPI
jgi:hypothetical protein